MQVAFVVQRYGEEICGGAEQHCRLVAEHLTPYVDVDVLTTCALNHLPWDNYYPAGVAEINGVRVHRFPVDQIRDHRSFDRLSYRVFGGPHTYLDELAWIELLGPHSAELLAYISANRREYDLFVFMTYQYFPTVFGLPIVPERRRSRHSRTTIARCIWTSTTRCSTFPATLSTTRTRNGRWWSGASAMPTFQTRSSGPESMIPASAMARIFASGTGSTGKFSRTSGG